MHLPSWLDGLAQWLVNSPLWVQTPAVVLAAVVLCMLLALVLLRAIDVLGARSYRVFNGAELPLNQDAQLFVRPSFAKNRQQGSWHSPELGGGFSIVVAAPPVGELGAKV